MIECPHCGKPYVDAAHLTPGTRVGRLVITGVRTTVDAKRHQRIVCDCQCDCGASVTIRRESIVSGRARSCGCIRRQHHKYRSDGVSTSHPLYATWLNIQHRCESRNHKDYKYYGARGIKVCERWRSFKHFLADVGERPAGMTLDRVDVDGDYEPNNFRWATRSQQVRNRRPFKWKRERKTGAKAPRR